MFTQTVEYALRAVVFLADASSENRVNSEQIFRATKVPKAYLSKVLKQLTDAGIITSIRGARGGFQLARSPANISVLDVINAVEPIQRIDSCPLNLKAHKDQLCPLHCRMDQAIATMEKEFARSTLAEILADPSSSKPLCESPKSSNGVIQVNREG